MRFVKMQGAGNDYVYVDCFDQTVADAPALARAVSDRHFGIGADGLILVMPSTRADVRMRMFNADGGEAQMCGNGVRCLAKYTYDSGRSRVNPMRVETGAGVLTLQLRPDGQGKVASARVDMGEPILDGRRIPVAMDANPVVNAPLRAAGRDFAMTCVSMGNPHTVIYVDDLSAVQLEEWGRAIECHDLFPQRVNAHFVQVISPAEVRMATWERGSGITLACGTGASAVCVAGVLTGRSGREILAHLPGGDLNLEWSAADNHVFMTGPAVEVFRGEWPGEKPDNH